jgi:hypothetical protein
MIFILAVAALDAPAPPAASYPYVNTGSFRCDLKNEEGDSFTLKGSNSNAKKDGDREISVFEIEAPAKFRIAGKYYATFKVDSFTMKNWVNHTSHAVPHVARWTNLSLIGDPRQKRGAAFLSTMGEPTSKQNDTFIGFCDYDFASAPQKALK